MKKVISFVSFCLLLFSTVVYGQLNYKFSATSSTYSPINGTAMSWTSTTPNDEEYTSAVDIGFNFNYAGTIYTQLQVSTNGFLQLGTGLNKATNTDALDGTLRQVIAPLWDDLAVTSTSSDITYQMQGSAPNRIFTVEWNNVKWNKTATASNAQFQVKLYEGSNKIEFIYGAMSAPASGSASIGLSDPTAITSAGSATGKYLSVNVGGTPGTRVYHLTRSAVFNAINNAPDANTKFTFTPVTPTPIPAGTYTIGGTNPDYASLSEAANALNVNGIAGPVVLNVRPGTYDDVFHLIAVNGTSTANTITLKNESDTVIISPKNGVSGSTSGASNADAIIRLDGTQYTTIQGLTLRDNGQSTVVLKYEVGIMVGNSQLNGAMVSGARFNHFKDLNIDMKCTTGVTHPGAIGIRYFTSGSTETDTTKGTSYNKIENCNITGFWRAGWKTFGINGTNPNRGNVVTGSTFGNVAITTGVGSDVRALEIDCEANLIIENNKIQNIEVSIMTTNNIYGIWFNPAGSATNLNGGTIIIRNNQINSLKNSGTAVTTGVAIAMASNNVANNTEFQIYGNKIFDIYSSCTTTGRAGGIMTNLGTGTPTTTKIYNNMIYDLRAPQSTTAPGVRGIDVQNLGGNGTFYVYNNTVYLDNAVQPAVTGTNVAHRSACVYWGNFGTANLELKNNILVNTMGTSATGTGVSAASCIYPSASSNILRLTAASDNNLMFAGTTAADRGVAFDGTTVYKTLADLQAVANFGTREANSFSADPTSSFVSAVSPYDVHMNTASWLAKGQGIPTALVTNDIDGDVRSTDLTKGPVCLGADEYQATGKANAAVTGTIADGQVSTLTGIDGKPLGEITWHKGTGVLPASIAVSYAPGAQLLPPNGSSIYRNYTITETGSTAGWNADLKLYYNASTELKGSNEAALKMYQNKGANWKLLETTVNTTNHYGSANVTSFGNYTFGDSTVFVVLPSVFSMKPTQLYFGSVFTNKSKQDSIVVTNTGQGDLVIDSIAVNNSAFSITPKNATIAPTEKGTFYVNFAPVSEGLKTANVIFYHNAATQKDTASVSGFGTSKYLLAEDFTSPAGTLLTNAGWALSGTSNVNPLTIGSTGLTFKDYVATGIGNALPLQATGQDLYASFPAVNSGSVYLSFMMNVQTAGTGDYFIALSPSNGQTNYYARLHVKSTTNGYLLGISKSNEVSGGAKYGTTVLPLNSTNMVVVKYNFLPADTTNDAISVYVFPDSAPIGEPATAEISAYVNAKTDATDLGIVTLRQGSNNAAPVMTIDGLRVGTKWDFSTAAPADTTPVVTIAQAREDLNSDFIPDRKGQTLKLSGVVISPDFTASAAGNNYYVTDGKAGILLYSTKKLTSPLNIGDSIFVKGKVDQYRGVTEFVPVDTVVGTEGSVTILKSNAKVPAPIEVSIKDLNSEKYEGCLVKVKGLIKTSTSPAWPLAAKNANLRVTQKGIQDSTILFIDLDTDIDGTTEPVWPQDITGIASQFTSSATVYNDGYEIIPRSTADFAKTSGVNDKAGKIPEAYALGQNYPNPFNPSTTISFDLRVNATVTLKVYSIIGQEIAVLADNSSMSAGHQQLSFNAANLPSGIYVYKIDVKGFDGSNFSGIRKMMLLK